MEMLIFFYLVEIRKTHSSFYACPRYCDVQNEGDPTDLQQHFSHYKSMVYFPDAQWQLTPQSIVGSCRTSNSFKILWLSLFSAKMKKIQSNMKVLE